MTATEYVVLVDLEDHEIGKAEKLEAHQKNLLHRAFSVFIFNDANPRQLLLQQRALNKYHSGGLWTNTCCSHPRPGENVINAAERRLAEEFGITTVLKLAGRFHYHARFTNGLSENEMDYVLVATISATTTLHPDPNEIHTYRWISLDVLTSELQQHPEHFTPWFAQALTLAI